MLVFGTVPNPKNLLSLSRLPASADHVSTDTTPPNFYGGYPAASNIQGTTFTLDLKVNIANDAFAKLA